MDPSRDRVPHPSTESPGSVTPPARVTTSCGSVGFHRSPLVSQTQSSGCRVCGRLTSSSVTVVTSVVRSLPRPDHSPH
ncbi:hypothetical protein J6590_011100 [Homalodisca vitripennis]|nr:hypothetical protein J6590_011100 [Homalodisca vitripennis]